METFFSPLDLNSLTEAEVLDSENNRQSVRLVLPQGGEQEEEEPAEFGQEEGAQDEARDVAGARGHLLLRRLLGALGTLVQKRLGKALRAN